MSSISSESGAEHVLPSTEGEFGDGSNIEGKRESSSSNAEVQALIEKHAELVRGQMEIVSLLSEIAAPAMEQYNKQAARSHKVHKYPSAQAAHMAKVEAAKAAREAKAKSKASGSK